MSFCVTVKKKKSGFVCVTVKKKKTIILRLHSCVWLTAPPAEPLAETRRGGGADYIPQNALRGRVTSPSASRGAGAAGAGAWLLSGAQGSARSSERHWPRLRRGAGSDWRGGALRPCRAAAGQGQASGRGCAAGGRSRPGARRI